MALTRDDGGIVSRWVRSPLGGSCEQLVVGRHFSPLPIAALFRDHHSLTVAGL